MVPPGPQIIGSFYLQTLFDSLLKEGYSIFIVRPTEGSQRQGLPQPDPMQFKAMLRENQMFISAAEIDAYYKAHKNDKINIKGQDERELDAALERSLKDMGREDGGYGGGEEEARPETATAKLGPRSFGWGEIYANPAATQQLLDDAEIDLEAWLAGEVELEFAKQEGDAFFSGNGVNKPFGILTYVDGGANAAKHPFGAIKVVNSGVAAGINGDSILDLVYDLPSAFTAGAKFALNRKTQGVVRKLKDAQGNYLWQPSLVAGQPSTLAGFAVQDVAAIPDVAANAIAALFAYLKHTHPAYARQGVRRRLDPLPHQPPSPCHV